RPPGRSARVLSPPYKYSASQPNPGDSSSERMLRGRRHQAAKVLRVNVELNSGQKIFDDLRAGRGRQKIYWTSLVQADRRPLQPLLGLLSASEHSRCHCQDFGKFPGSAGLLPAQPVYSATFLSALCRADAHSNGLLRRLHALAGEHGRDRKQPLAVRAHALVVVDELERAFAQLEDRDIRGRADVKGAAVVERREQTRGVDRGAGDD